MKDLSVFCNVDVYRASKAHTHLSEHPKQQGASLQFQEKKNVNNSWIYNFGWEK